MKRTFIAAPISDEVRELIRRIRLEIHGLENVVRLVKPEFAHITLKFIGDTSENDFESIVETIKRSLKNVSPFEVIIENTGVFPTPANPRVLWFGISEGISQLEKISNFLNREISKIGYPKEKRSFKGHITVGRVKNKHSSFSVVKKFLNFSYDPISFFVEKIIFYESVLRPDGAKYYPIYEIKI
ncbi:MAG: RNA 2',3'-cyclic phosphodiesterase [Candidatus Neomarinimicrobiota bacterium]|nr:RNA 2',3'-cyclic phosphodiesterase [Candidatus Neomarinimicrobiota bacterium]RKY48038.1 MAG: RNA 2',3'-cyclic phosphodiesterase [Candidatus Neomarinimicrobiota bacterium]HDN58478.1 RNA 2',3'-cyclic phosphodiesterase [Candidatus Neomarinimicrobiota bacterium]